MDQDSGSGPSLCPSEPSLSAWTPPPRRPFSAGPCTTAWSWRSPSPPGFSSSTCAMGWRSHTCCEISSDSRAPEGLQRVRDSSLLRCKPGPPPFPPITTRAVDSNGVPDASWSRSLRCRLPASRREPPSSLCTQSRCLARGACLRSSTLALAFADASSCLDAWLLILLPGEGVGAVHGTHTSLSRTCFSKLCCNGG